MVSKLLIPGHSFPHPSIHPGWEHEWQVHISSLPCPRVISGYGLSAWLYSAYSQLGQCKASAVMIVPAGHRLLTGLRSCPDSFIFLSAASRAKHNPVPAAYALELSKSPRRRWWSANMVLQKACSKLSGFTKEKKRLKCHEKAHRQRNYRRGLIYQQNQLCWSKTKLQKFIVWQTNFARNLTKSSRISRKCPSRQAYLPNVR
jgi:hypothetical protein